MRPRNGVGCGMTEGAVRLRGGGAWCGRDAPRRVASWPLQWLSWGGEIVLSLGNHLAHVDGIQWCCYLLRCILMACLFMACIFVLFAR